MKKLIFTILATLAMAVPAMAELTVHTIKQGNKIIEVAVDKNGQVVHYSTNTVNEAPVKLTWVRK